MTVTFRQADARWGNLVYTRGGSKMATAGCGATTEAMIITNNPKYANATPLVTRKWLMNNHYNIGGTTWDGITKGLEHFGFVQVHYPERDIAKAFAKLESGEFKWGAINFAAGRRGGVTWTNGGHYVCFSAYKKVNGKHYLYTRDPGYRHNDGWYCYETQMKGLIKQIWICHLKDEPKVEPPKTEPAKPAKKEKKKAAKKSYTGVIPKPVIKKGSKGKSVKQLQKFLNWYGGYKLQKDGSCGPLTVKAIKLFQKKNGLTPDGSFGPKTYKKALTYKK